MMGTVKDDVKDDEIKTDIKPRRQIKSHSIV